MADEEHVKILMQGVEVWNRWREENPDIWPGLRKAELREANLSGANLSGADLNRVNLIGANLSRSNLRRVDLGWANLSGACLLEAYLVFAHLTAADLTGSGLSKADLNRAVLIEANLSEANLREANLSEADLRGADLRGVDLHGTLIDDSTQIDDKWRLVWEIVNQGAVGRDLRGADLSGQNLNRADLSRADLSRANLTGTKLERATLVETNLKEATLTGCSIYGISAWNLNLEGATQTDLIISPSEEPVITVDNLEVAQFIYLLLHNEKIRHVIDTMTSKVVLILGRFAPERKKVLDAIRDELRKRDYLPVLFDFEKPASRDITETVSTLAHMARFVIADITDAKSIPQELKHIVPILPSLPIQPIILESEYKWGMFKDFGGFLSVLPPYRYETTSHLLASLEKEVIAPAMAKADEIEERRKEFEQSLPSSPEEYEAS